VDNDVNLAAMGELWFGAGQNVQNMILVSNGKGIGAGIVIDGALYRGASEASGEIGNFIPGREFLGKNYQAFGALESVASGTGMLERARSLLAGAAQNGAAALTEDDLLQAARQGQPWAVTVMQETADYLAIAIANLTSSFDPELIVLGGSLPLFAESLVQPILRRMESVLPALPKLVVSDLGLRAGVMGAVINVLHNTSNFYVVHKLS
jgi:glucokinase